jgi:uncharacterized protein (TIGR02231 family)
MRSIPLTLLVALAALPVVALPAKVARAADKVVDVTSVIQGVTVYPDRAQVTRVAHVDLTPGTYAVRFNHLPLNLMADSVRVGGTGTAQVMLHGFDLKTKFLGQSPDKQVVVLESQLLTLEDKDRGLADQRAVHDRQLQVLITTAKRAGDSLASQLAAGRAKLSDWQALLGFLKTQQLAESVSIQTLDRARRDLVKDREKLTNQLNKLRGFRQEATHQVPVTVEVLRGGTLDLALEYVVPGARWTPAYDARLDSEEKTMDWGYYGVVSQQTGENWSGVHLKLSTATPASGSQPPAVSGWFLSLNQMPPPAPKAAYGAANNMQQMNRRAQAAAPAPAVASDREDKPQSEPAAESQAVVTDQGTSVTLDVPRDVNIPSDGEPHQTPVGHAAFVPKVSYKVIPRVSPEAYLMVETLQAGPWPILPGPVKAFVGHDYIGTSMLQQDLVPGQRFSLALGADRGIQVRRQRLEKNIGEAGLLRKGGFAQYKYEIAVTNYKKRPQTIQVVEPLPQSTEDPIHISVDTGNQPQMATNPPGQARWELKLAPGEKKLLQWGYKVEYPEGQLPTGLE